MCLYVMKFFILLLSLYTWYVILILYFIVLSVTCVQHDIYVHCVYISVDIIHIHVLFWDSLYRIWSTHDVYGNLLKLVIKHKSVSQIANFFADIPLAVVLMKSSFITYILMAINANTVLHGACPTKWNQNKNSLICSTLWLMYFFPCILTNSCRLISCFSDIGYGAGINFFISYWVVNLFLYGIFFYISNIIPCAEWKILYTRNFHRIC